MFSAANPLSRRVDNDYYLFRSYVQYWNDRLCGDVFGQGKPGYAHVCCCISCPCSQYRRFTSRRRASRRRRRQIPAAPAVGAPRHAASPLHRHPTTQRHSLVSRPAAVALVVAVAAVTVGAAVDAPGRLHHHPAAHPRSTVSTAHPNLALLPCTPPPTFQLTNWQPMHTRNNYGSRTHVRSNFKVLQH